MIIAFKADQQPLVEQEPRMGTVAVLPWDAQYFGFNVGTYAPPNAGAEAPPSSSRLKQLLHEWMCAQSVEMVSCAVPGHAVHWLACLSIAGFAFVDMALLAFARKLTSLPPARVKVRAAESADEDRLVEISGSAFQFGRYHTDARFPRGLADNRYRYWIRNALAARSGREFVFVTGPVGAPTGFMHATLDGTCATLHLAAVDADQNAGILGPALFVSALHELVAKGARSAKARLAAANTVVLSLYASLGFTFPEAEAVFHLHAADATHLEPAI